MAWANRMRRYAGRLALLLLVAVPASHSLAGACAPSGAEAARLQRQISANLGLAARHDCSAGNSAFACREIAARLSQARGMLAAMPSSCKPMMASVAAKPRRVAARSDKTRDVPRPVRLAARTQTLCVRLSDGYFFPTPRSGFQAGPAAGTALAAQCQFICETAAMDVFREDPVTGRPEDMISLTSGTRYGDLPHAGLYRQASSPGTCDMGRIALLDPSNAAISAPPEPVTTTVAALDIAPADVLFRNVGLRGTRTDIPSQPRKVRRVGPAFLPDL